MAPVRSTQPSATPKRSGRGTAGRGRSAGRDPAFIFPWRADRPLSIADQDFGRHLRLPGCMRSGSAWWRRLGRQVLSRRRGRSCCRMDQGSWQDVSSAAIGLRFGMSARGPRPLYPPGKRHVLRGPPSRHERLRLPAALVPESHVGRGHSHLPAKPCAAGLTPGDRARTHQRNERFVRSREVRTDRAQQGGARGRAGLAQ
jgi:hypothetical protein